VAKNFYVAIVYVFFAIALFISYGLQAQDYRISLPNGYDLVRANAYEVFITRRETRIVIISGEITEYGVVDHIVAGHLRIPRQPGTNVKKDYPDVVEGYFVLDTSKQTASMGLSQDCMLKHLMGLGFKSPPQLAKPK